MENDERRAEIIRRYELGETYETIGRAVGLTRQRVEQLLTEYGVTKSPRKSRQVQLVVGREDELIALFLELRDDAAVAARSGIPVHVVKGFVNLRVPYPAVLRRQPRDRQPLYSDQDLIDALRAAAAALPSPLTTADYAAWCASRKLPDGRRWPGTQASMLRFGGWRSALLQAALPANPTSGPDRTFEREDVVAALVTAWREGERVPTVAVYERWHAENPNFPSSATIRNRGDGWGELLLSAWTVVTRIELPDVKPPLQLPPEPPGAPSVVGVPYRTPPPPGDAPASVLFERDPQVMERALASHVLLQNRMRDAVVTAGLQALSPSGNDPEFDIAWRQEDGRLGLAEIKSATASNLESQLRIAVGQILRYSQILTDRGESVRPVLVVELAPPDGHWSNLLERLSIEVLVGQELDGLEPGFFKN